MHSVFKLPIIGLSLMVEAFKTLNAILIMKLKSILILIVFPLITYAQMGPQQVIYGGGSFGISAAWIINQTNYGFAELDYVPEIGYSFGASGGMIINRGNAIEVDLLYTRQGQKYEDVIEFFVDSFNRVKKEVRLHYLQVPVVFKHIFDLQHGDFDKEDPKFFLGAGLQFGFLTKAKVQYYRDGIEENFALAQATNSNIEEPPAKSSNLFNKIDISLVGTMGVRRYLTEKLIVSIEAKGGLSMTDMNQKNWQFENPDGIYKPSRNMLLTLKLSAFYELSSSKSVIPSDQ